MNKTIKQVADELGVTKQTVQYHYKFLSTKNTKRNDKGTILVDLVGQRFIADRIKNKSTKENDKKTTKNEEETAKENGENISSEFLMKQLVEKDRLINELVDSQKNLQKLLDQQQVLTLQANKKIEQLELKEEQTFEDDQNKQRTDSDYATSSEDKKSFWTRFFKS